jgi:hypothetical protein
MSETLYRLNDADYEPLGPLGGDRLRLRFRGPFEGNQVLWDATFVTLRHLAAEQPDKTWHNFIDIGEPDGGSVPLTVGLNVECFDARTITMAIMMVRRYKRLRRGRHEYGPPFPPGRS